MSGSLHTLGWSLLHAAAGMPARQRRRADVVLLAVLVAVVGAVAAFSVAAADAERVVGLWLGAEVSSDGSARITEVVDYQFGNARRHGIFRDVGGLRPDAPVAVWSATAPDRVALFGDERETRIRVGDSARTIDGTHRYLIRYPLRRFAPNGRVAWSMVGTAWRVKVDAVEFHMAAPFAFTRVRCVHPDGSPVACDVTQPEPGHLIGRISGLAAREGATVHATAGRYLGDARRLPVPPSGAIAPFGTMPLAAGLLAAVAALLAAVATSWLLRRWGRECLPAGAVGAAGEEARVDVKDLEARVAVDGERPPGLTAARGGVVFAEGVRDEHKAAWLISAAIDGHFDVSFEWSGRAQRVTLTRRVPGGSAHSDESTAAVLEQAFGHRRQLTLDGYDEHFAEAWNRLGEELAAWRKTSGLWDPTGDDRCLRAFLVGLIVAVLGVILTVGGGIAASQWSWAWTVVVATGAAAAGAGLAAVVCAWELRIRMPAGVAAWLRVESFRRFLATAGPHEADEATQRGQLGVCTAWAMALGEIDCWSEAVAASVARSRRQVLVHDPAWAPVLLNAAAATASMFGGSGDTGGGDSGSGGGDGGSEGGDGGGDGGSW